jgi:hypothetical protein
MPDPDIARMRLCSQRIAAPRLERAADVVAALGAVQAQDYRGGLWGIALRTRDAGMADVEQAVVDKHIVRTWPMRYTLHFVPAPDVRWMLALTGPRAVTKAAGRHRTLELDAPTFRKARRIVERALGKQHIITRAEFYAVLARGGVDPSGQRGPHILGQLAHDGVVCFGPRDGAQQTIVLLDDWLPDTRSLNREEALTTIARRYFESHGPATDRDFAWWTGLTLTEARRGIEAAAPDLAVMPVGDTRLWLSRNVPQAGAASSPDVHLLPPWDEYLVGYTDRSHLLADDHASDWDPGNRGLITPTIIIDGRVAGTWRRTIEKDRATVAFNLFRTLAKRERDAMHDAAESYGRVLGLSIRMRESSD